MSRLQRMNDALYAELNPDPLFIENESDGHHVPAGSETHFKIVAVSSRFEGLTALARHRMVNTCLKDEFAQGLHALTMHLYTPLEWQKKANEPTSSPDCHRGKHRD